MLYKNYMSVVLLFFVSSTLCVVRIDNTNERERDTITTLHNNSHYRWAVTGTILTGLGVAATTLWSRRTRLAVRREQGFEPEGRVEQAVVVQEDAHNMGLGQLTQPRRHPRLQSHTTFMGGPRQGETDVVDIFEKCHWCRVNLLREYMHWCECPPAVYSLYGEQLSGRTPQEMEDLPHFICDDCFAKGRHCKLCQLAPQ